MVEKRRRKEKKNSETKSVREKKEECKRVNVCGDSKFGDKCKSSGALKSKKYYKYSIGYSFDFDKKCNSL